MSVQLWRVDALHPPRVPHACATCGCVRPFSPSDCFRVNTNGKWIDVWLIYHCSVCDRSWNRRVGSRTDVARLGLARYQRLVHNDSELVWKCAFSGAPRQTLPYRVVRPAADTPPREILIRQRWPCGVRLDRLLATELGVARAALRSACDPGAARSLRRPVRDGQRVTLDCAALWKSRPWQAGSGTS